MSQISPSSHGQRLKRQAMGRAFARVGMQNKNPDMLQAAQSLLAASQQTTEGPTMSEKQSDIAERLRVMADDLVLFKEIDTGADDMREAADEIEALRADLDKSAKLAYSAVLAERAGIVELVEKL
jgi:hypothetical protein